MISVFLLVCSFLPGAVGNLTRPAELYAFFSPVLVSAFTLSATGCAFLPSTMKSVASVGQ